MESKKLALLCRDLAENKKAENTVILDVRNLSSITDFFVITSGAPNRTCGPLSTRFPTGCARITACPRGPLTGTQHALAGDGLL